MVKTALKVLMASSVSAVVVFGTDADAAGKRRGPAYSAAPVMMKADRTAVRRTKVNGIKRIAGPRTGVPAQGPAAKPSTADVMAGICNGAGGGASTHPDGTVHCTDPDGNDALPPVPVPD